MNNRIGKVGQVLGFARARTGVESTADFQKFIESLPAGSEELRRLIIDGMIFGCLLDALYAGGKTPNDAFDWMIANGVSAHFAQAWLQDYAVPPNQDR